MGALSLSGCWTNIYMSRNRINSRLALTTEKKPQPHFVEAIECSEESLNSIGGSGDADTSHRWQQFGKFLFCLLYPFIYTQLLGWLLQLLQPSPDCPFVISLKHSLHLLLSGCYLILILKSLFQPSGDALLIVKVDLEVIKIRNTKFEILNNFVYLNPKFTPFDTWLIIDLIL